MQVRLQRFLQKILQSKTNYYDIKANDTNREIFFSTMCDTDKQYWGKINIYRAFWLSNLYVQFTYYGGIASSSFIEKLPSYYEQVKPVINFEQRANYIIYKALPREIGLDILTFLALENYAYKFKIHNMSTNILINETILKIILKDYGMVNMPDPVIDIGFKGYDALKRRQYNPLEVAKMTIITQAVASEHMRHNELIDSSKIPSNKDDARIFPHEPRRHPSTERVF